MPASYRQLQIHPSKFKLGEHISPTFSGGAINAFNTLIMPFWISYLGGARVRQLIEAGYFRIGINGAKPIARSPGNSSPDEIKKNTAQYKRTVDFLRIIFGGYEYDFRLSQDAFPAEELVNLLTVEMPPTEPDGSVIIDEQHDDGDGDDEEEEESEEPVPTPAPPPPPTPEPPTAPVPVVVASEPEPAPIVEAPAPVVEVVEAGSGTPEPEQPTETAPTKPAAIHNTEAPEKKAASGKKKPPTKRPAVRKTVAKKPEPKSPALPKTETYSRVNIKPEVTDLDREIAYKAALLAELQQLRKDTLAKAEEIETRLAKAHGQKH